MGEKSVRIEYSKTHQRWTLYELEVRPWGFCEETLRFTDLDELIKEMTRFLTEKRGDGKI